MADRALDQVRTKFLRLLRTDPPPGGATLALDAWALARFSREEIEVMLRAEREYGERVMSEWLGELLVEAGLAPHPLRLAS